MRGRQAAPTKRKWKTRLQLAPVFSSQNLEPKEKPPLKGWFSFGWGTGILNPALALRGRQVAPRKQKWGRYLQLAPVFSPPYRKQKKKVARCATFFFCQRAIKKIFSRFCVRDLNPCGHSAQSILNLSVVSNPPTNTTLISSLDSTTTHSIICLTIRSSYCIG